MNALSNKQQNPVSQELTQLTRFLRRGDLAEVAVTAAAPNHLHLSADFSSPGQNGAYTRTWAIARQFELEHPQVEMTGKFELPGGSIEVVGRNKR